MCSADHICSEYYYHLFKRQGRNVRRAQVYKNVHSKKPKYWAAFEKLAIVCEQYNIDYQRYITYVFDNNGSTYLQPSELLNIKWFRLYADHLKLIEQYQHVYDSFMKAANYIADECIKNHYSTTAEYIKHLILTDQLASYFLGGRITKYWLASIKQLPLLVSKLNGMSRDTLTKVVRNQLQYNNEIQEAFVKFTSKRVRPFIFTDRLIEKKLESM